jgi:thymidine phosphorylase
MTGKAKTGKGVAMAREVLLSGNAFKKFVEIIKSQRGSIKNLHLGNFTKDIVIQKPCKISEIDNKKINSLARVAGCPLDKSSGLYLHHHVGEKLKKGDKILTIYAESKPRLNEAIYYYNKQKPITFE